MEARKFVVTQAEFGEGRHGRVLVHKSCKEPMIIRRLRVGERVEATGDVEEVRNHKYIPVKLQDGTLGAVDFGYLKELPIEWDIGEKVERRMKGEAWGIGRVTSVDPLMVTFFDSPTGEGYRWDEVRKFKEAKKEEEKKPKGASGFFTSLFGGSKEEKANSTEATPANYGSMATSDSAEQTEQKLEYAGAFGGQGTTMCFFQVFEGALCCFLILFVYLTFKYGLLFAPFLFAVCCMHCCIQLVITCADPAGVYATLWSLEQGMEDKQTAAVFEELRSVPATVKMVAEKYHTEMRPRGVHDAIQETTLTEEVIDHREQASFHYASWKDVSGSVAGLDEYKVVAVEVVPVIQCADPASADGLKSLTDRLEDACRQHPPSGGSVRSCQKISLGHPKYEVQGSRVFVTHGEGQSPSVWMNRCTYTGCRFVFPGFGAIFRFRLFTSLAHVRYYIKKRISINRQEGAGWAANHVV